MKLTDKRTKINHDIRKVLYFMAGVTILALGQKVIEIANRPTWASSQLHPELVQYMFDDRELNPQNYIKAPEPTPEPRTNEDIIREVFGEDSDRAIQIAKCESGLRSDAWNENTNGSVDVGLFQINSVHGVRAKWLLNPDINIQVAKQLFDEQGFNPWVCFWKGLI